jgi:hypothetical protein
MIRAIPEIPMSYLHPGRHREFHAAADQMNIPRRRSSSEGPRYRHLLTAGADPRPKSEFVLRFSSNALGAGNFPAANDPESVTRSRGWLVLLGSIAGCLAAIFTSLHGAGFVGNFVVPHSMDSVAGMPLFAAVVVDLNLIAAAALTMLFLGRWDARRNRGRVIPAEHVRGCCLLLASLAFNAVFMFWQPAGLVLWQVEDSVARGMLLCMCVGGWLLLLGASLAAGHAELFGVRAAWRYFRSEPDPSKVAAATGQGHMLRDTPALGWLLLVWSTPVMDAAHLLVAVVISTLALIPVAGAWPESNKALSCAQPLSC